ncbi:hypothetical protein RhiirA1_478889 [Rhizophagus irregularis]|uniref:Uncharacterized protein n=1 Tax=Rhizophagus irregularis TaxID=588596 RepID=A0A2N0QRE9_9GLOM|nr:hypothetical protein RhiirA1_478889 [Rhizophagus irregularis]GET65055.1 hypothetical protein RIR_jg21024.t1 [Rhizophagus irregularis DAOM 181602=DAOM 197198]
MGAVILLVVQCPSISRDLRESQSKESQFISRLLMHWNWNRGRVVLFDIRQDMNNDRGDKVTTFVANHINYFHN